MAKRTTASNETRTRRAWVLKAMCGVRLEAEVEVEDCTPTAASASETRRKTAWLRTKPRVAKMASKNQETGRGRDR